MTDIKPGSRWLLPVTFRLIPPVRWVFDTATDCLDLSLGDLATLIPADRITELEAEVARWQGLYEDAMARVLDAELEAERLREEMLRERD